MTRSRFFLITTICVFLGLFVAYYQKEKGVDESADLASSESTKVLSSELQIAKEISAGEDSELKEIDRIRKFFTKGMDKFPIVQTITYSSRVPWLKGRPAWVADYASHYQTSRHFIARSLNGKSDYFTQNVSGGDKFNVFKEDCNIKFYLLIDLQSCTLDFYYLDEDSNERVFVKQYPVGVGREDKHSPSGYLTPIGKYTLGDKIAVYKPGIEHYYQNVKTQMIEVFGSRWLPFGEEIENCSDSAKGYGIHGTPFTFNEETEEWEEQIDTLKTYNSDGCVRLSKNDIEELFSIVVTKPTIVEIVKDKSKVELPMAKEKLFDD